MPREPAKGKQRARIIGLPREPTAQEFGAALKAAGIDGLTFTPIQLHAFILKLVLKDRITDAEIALITTTYRDLINEWWGK